MNGVARIVAPVAGSPTTPLVIVLIWMTQSLLLTPGGGGVAEISLKSSRPAIPVRWRPTVYVSPRPAAMHASASSASAGGAPPRQATSATRASPGDTMRRTAYRLLRNTSDKVALRF